MSQGVQTAHTPADQGRGVLGVVLALRGGADPPPAGKRLSATHRHT